MTPRRLAAWLARALISLALLAAILLPGAPAPVRAADLAVQTDQATPAFPNSITFQLTADVATPVVSAELRYRPDYSPVTQVERPKITTGRHLDIRYALDMRTRYLPPGIDIHYRWRLTLQDGRTLETPEKTLFYMDQAHPWQTLTARQVTLYYYAGNPSFGQEALDTTVGSIERFKQTFDVEANEPVRVVMYGSARDFGAALPANSDEWIGGFTDPELHLIVVGILPGDIQEIHRMLSHEVVHLVMAQATDNPYNEPPSWLNEGLASYYQEVPDPRFTPLLDQAVKTGRLDSVRALNSEFPTDPTRALLSYAESESIVRFIIESQGTGKMADLIRVFRDGVSYDEAVQRALGMSTDQLDAAWKAWLGYPGDAQGSTATVRHDGGGMGRLGDLIVWGAEYGVMGAVALAAIGAGSLVLARRARIEAEDGS